MTATTSTTETAYDLLCSGEVIGSYRSLNDARRGAASRLKSAPAVGSGCYSIRNTDFSEENEFQPVFADINHLYGAKPFPGCEAPAELAFNAGRLDCRFRERAVAAGGPYTTRALIETGESATTLTPLGLRNITGRMARFLSPAEIAQWVAGIEAIKADPALAVKYNLGSM